ncbi:MAG: tail fiber domain-containing protein [Chlorobi bacterium]|nr:tail fiber domain-containing protein [Chlorobiota bacterium]
MKKGVVLLLLGCLVIDSLAQRVGIGEAAPQSKLAVAGNVSIGSTYSAFAAPPNGLIVEGKTGIGTSNPVYFLDIFTVNDYGGMRVKGTQNTLLIVESAAGTEASLCFVQAGLRKFCIGIDSTGDFLRVERYDSLGTLISDSVVIIDRRTGFVGLATIPTTYKLELPNVPTTEGQAIANQWLTYSDSTLKSNITSLDKRWAYNTIRLLRPVQYVHHPSYKKPDGTIRIDTTTGEIRLGFIAQEVKHVLPHAVDQTKEGVHTLDYSQILAVAIRAMQAQREEIERLRQQVSELHKQLEKYKSGSNASQE